MGYQLLVRIVISGCPPCVSLLEPGVHILPVGGKAVPVGKSVGREDKDGGGAGSEELGLVPAGAARTASAQAKMGRMEAVFILKVEKNSNVSVEEKG